MSVKSTTSPGSQPEADGDLDVPKDDADLARAYRWLVNHANENDAVPIRLARKQLAQTTSFERGDVRRFVLEPLRRRGYVKVQDAPPGEKTAGVIRVREKRL